ncbi:MAG: PGN_0703 family putative restriction endonuclease [Paracraurococcus sp.]
MQDRNLIDAHSLHCHNQKMNAFILGERLAQADFFARTVPAEAIGFDGSSYRLLPQHRTLNLAPNIRDLAVAYFTEKRIVWHRHANHALSSQVACLNFLMPLATRPQLLASIIGKAFDMTPPEMLPVENGPDETPWFVGFEWIGRCDYLNEAGKSGARTRGANVTSADAMVRFKAGGRIESVLIEWKYTGRYGAPLPPKGNAVRAGRYKDLMFAPLGPLVARDTLKVGDFFWEPHYQLLRQQMLAFQMQKAAEDKAERVRLLHISPAANLALHKVTSPALKHHGADAFGVFQGLLTRRDDFTSLSTETVFETALSSAAGGDLAWADYLTDRYTFLRPAMRR